MEPHGRPLTPGTSYGPPSLNSAQNAVDATVPNCTLKSPCSPNVRDGLMSAKALSDHTGDEDSRQREGAQPSADPGSAQRRFRSSAFPSSLSWDSDSEKETLDEEEQHFSNLHGLAAHSPGSPSSALRLNNEDDQEAENLQRLRTKTDSPSPLQGYDESTKTEESNACRPGPIEHSTVWNVSERAELSLAKAKPKDGCQKDEEADNSEGQIQPKGKEMKEPERDVYSFPGDSDPESPPPAPWAHCTFIQQCRKKRVLLRPFSGLGTVKHTSLEPGKQASVSPQKSKPAESAHFNEGGGVYKFGEAAVDEPIKFRDRGGTRDQEGETEVVPSKEIFTCVECSIYFKKQVHLQEHIVEHCQSGAGGGRRSGKGGRFRCNECGWDLPNQLVLADHHRRHQESRTKILEEIEKLNESGKAREMQNLDCQTVKPISSDPALVQDPSKASTPDEESDLEIVTFPPPSPAMDTDPVVLDSDIATPNSVRVPTQARAAVSYRRRFICTKCNFSTRTSQALANHIKTHNRKKPAHQADSSSSGPPSCLASTSLACGHCAFLTSSQTVMREHQRLVHSGGASISRALADETGQRPSVHKAAQISDCLSPSQPNTSQGKNKQGVAASDSSTVSDSAAAQPTGQVVFKGAGSRRFRLKGKTWTDLAKFHPRLDDDKLSESEEEEQDEGQSTGLDTECSQQEAVSPVGVRPHTRARSNAGDCSEQQISTLLLSPKKTVNDQDKAEVDKDGRVFFLRRRNRFTAASAEIDSDDEDNDDDDDDEDDDDDDDDDIDEECMQHFLSEGIFDEDNDETLKSVERKCPYCPDRFHNGIGLANHVRGHLNRVGVSYNVRHFISPEEVNAIEKKFSYQKKKKKVANFDPDTFSVMHCEFCSAGFDTRAGLSSHARAHLRDFGITNWDVTISPIHILRELFSSRPDLVIPTANPGSPGSSLEESEEEEKKTEEEGEGIVGVRLNGETSGKTQSVAASDAQPSESSQRFKIEDSVEECEGEEEDAAEEEDEEELQPPALGGLSSNPGKTGLCSVDTDGLPPGEDADSKVHELKCEVSGAQCESRRGLSSHARPRVRQLGIGLSESNGTPVDHLRQIAEERNLDRRVSPPLLEPLLSENSPPSAPPKDVDLEDMNVDQKPIPLSVLAKVTKAVPPSSSSSSSTPTPSPGASPAPPHSGSPSSVVRKAPISSLLPASPPWRPSEHKAGGTKSLTSNLSAPGAITPKPLWAPQENDAPLNLTLDVDPDKDIVCQLCGAWFETRKGLSSHARAHLRHFGVEYSESKGSPIDVLSQLIDNDEFKHNASGLQLDGPPERPGLPTTSSAPKQASLLSVSSSPSSPSHLYKVTTAGGGSTSKATSASSLLGPPSKRPKSSSVRVFRLSNGELMALPHSETPKEIGCEFCGEYFENRKGLSSHARSHLRQMGITEWSVNGSPIDTLRDIITRRGLPCALPLKPLKTPPASSPGPPRSPPSISSPPSATLLGHLPFARPTSSPQPAVSRPSAAPPASSSGFLLRLKPEPVQLDVTPPGAVGRSDTFSGQTLNWSGSDSAFPLNLAVAHEAEPTRDIRCEFCGEYFENRKGLSSHARSHLRQMGITEWSVNGSPIDTLREVMYKRGAGASSQSVQGVKTESSHGANGPPWEKTGGTGSSQGFSVPGYKSSKFRKSFSLLQSGLKLHKPGPGSVGTSATPPGGKYFRISPLGKRPLSEEAQSVETGRSATHQPKTFSPLPHDFSFKRKPSPDKHGHQDPSCELCGFLFENRKALASHARAHLRQFGVTEWSVNGSPIETLSAWMRSRPQKVLEMHRSYMQGNRSALKKKASSSSSQWPSSLAVSPVRSLSCEVSQGSSRTGECDAGAALLSAPTRPSRSSPGLPRLAGGGPSPQAQVARSELNVRLPRGLERRPLKHPSYPDGTERDSGSPRPPRTGTVPALVPKPPSYPLVKLVGKFYTLKCRFCEVEFHGPLSVQEDWIRHLQQHILKMNYNKPAAPKATSAGPPAPADDPAPAPASAPASTSTSSTASTTPPLTSAPARTTAPNGCSASPPAESAAPVTAAEMVKVSEEQPVPSPPSIAPPIQTV